MKQKLIVLSLLLMVISIIPFAYAHAGHEHSSFEQAEAIINVGIPCDDLSENQLEMLGDYYMEKMHPGEAHEQMDLMMGGEGSEQLKKVHIRMAKNNYCNENTGMMGGLMNMMGTTGYGMRTGMGWFGGSVLWLLYVALAAFIFGIIFWWTYKLMIGKKKFKR